MVFKNKKKAKIIWYLYNPLFNFRCNYLKIHSSFPDNKKILTRKETERVGLKFGFIGKRKQPLKKVYTHSTPESITEFEKSQIDEDTFRARAKAKKQRDLTSFYKKKQMYKDRHANLTDKQLDDKRERDRKYRESIRNN